MIKFEPNSPLDLLEIRRQLTAMRSHYSDDRRVTAAINELIGKLAHLHEPKDLAHEKLIRKTIAKTVQAVEKLISDDIGRAARSVSTRDKS